MQAIDLELTNAEVEVRQLEARLRVVPMNDAQLAQALNAAERQALPEAVGLHGMLVEMRLRGIHDQIGEDHVLDRLDGLAAGVAHHGARCEILEIIVLASERREFHGGAVKLCRTELGMLKPSARLPGRASAPK